MREFARQGFELRSAQWELKIVYTGFLCFASAGLLTNGIFQVVRIGITYQRLVAYYRGGDLGQGMAFPKTFGELLELSHFHTFIMGVIFLILAHLLLATSIRPRLKAAFILLAFLGSLLDVAGYWLIRYISPGFALVQLTAWAAMWIGYGGMIIAPLWEMWGTKDGRLRKKAARA
ncbi:MAG: hypothetical protein ACE5G5_07170 [Candidatus Methylomirabilales bacterium]